MARYFLILALMLVTFYSQASDLAKEKRWAEQIEDSLLDGELVYLSDGANEFLAIDTLASEPKETALILLHGIGVHPDWPQVIHPLRVQLPEGDWRTLSLQLPILPNEADATEYQALMKEVPARVNAGVRYLQSMGAKKIVIVAHSMGALMASYYLAQAKPTVVGYIGIGMGPGNTQHLANIRLPILDLYGEHDLTAVLESASARAEAASGNKEYAQKKIEAADHFFDGHETALLDAVTAWLEQH